MIKYGIAIHGGLAEPEDELQEKQMREGLEEALSKGWDVLKQNGTALDAVEQAVILLENNSLFNAGRGASLTIDGIVELDASIMNGIDLKAGAVTGTRKTKNPVVLARHIMENTRHVFLCGTGADEYAEKNNLEIVEQEYFKSKEIKEIKKAYDTVGALAFDIKGNIAAASSTGGLKGQLTGRVGDTPIIGGGIYANNEVCGAIFTGEGELIMRGVYAHEIYALMKYKGLSLNEACTAVMEMNDKILKAEMGVIAVDNKGIFNIQFNTPAMPRGIITSKGEMKINIYK